jgi:hypothetical protein
METAYDSDTDQQGTSVNAPPKRTTRRSGSKTSLPPLQPKRKQLGSEPSFEEEEPVRLATKNHFVVII